MCRRVGESRHRQNQYRVRSGPSMRYPVERFSVKCGVVLFLNGFGQIMFQQSALTGIFFFIGICTNSWFMASGGILGALSGVITARFLAFKSDDILQGVYGFNGALVGVALIFSLRTRSAFLPVNLVGRHHIICSHECHAPVEGSSSTIDSTIHIIRLDNAFDCSLVRN